MRRFKKAILIIHGFSGGTFDEEYLAHELELNSKYDVYNFTLPGHDGEFKDKITYESWIQKCDEEMKFLINNGYKKIYLVGHSMGGVLACLMASKYPQVKKLVLGAPAFRIFGFEDGNTDIEDAIKKIPKIAKEYGVNTIFSKFLRMPGNSVSEFIRFIKDNQNAPCNIKCPTLILRGNDDNVVPEESVVHVFQNLKSIQKRVIHINGTSHELFRENTKEYICKLVLDFFKNTNCIYLFVDQKNEE